MISLEPLLFVALVGLLCGLLAVLWRELDWPLAPPVLSNSEISSSTQLNAGDAPHWPIATLYYTIDDPLAPGDFNRFLDEPVLTLHGPAFRRDEPPARTLEQAVRALLADVDEEYAGQLSVRIDVQRGSLTLGLTVLGAYQFLAQYQDFLTSVHTLRNQIETLFQTTASQYHAHTGHRAHVDSDMSIEPSTFSPSDARRPTTANAEVAPRPTSYADTDVRITVQTAPPLAGALTCGLVLLVAALTALLLATVGCAWSNVDCGELVRPFWSALLTL